MDELQRADPTPVGSAPHNPEVARVIGRASVVLLSSHFERYIYAMNEEATQLLNDAEIQGHLLPEGFRLLHSQLSIDTLVATSWENRGEKLASFIELEAWLWSIGSSGVLDHNRLLLWMKAPSPRNLVRYFRIWGISDVFRAITRAQHTQSELRLRIGELVQKRNNIAHGDLTIEATHTDVASYREVTMKFSERADRVLGKVVGGLIGRQTAW